MTSKADDAALRGRYGGPARPARPNPTQPPRPAWVPSYRGCAGCHAVRRAVAAVAGRILKLR